MHCECNPNNMRNFEDIKIAVAGTGYVGLSIATLLSQHHEVTAVDVIPEKVEKNNKRMRSISPRRRSISKPRSTALRLIVMPTLW